ncbi:MAG: undecaprenyl-diphosphate phosphatase [Kiritimatiellae bacterium]|nr:undecaprenyl-diphosphate phosphatase [Kiritimatiellia bacterium]
MHAIAQAIVLGIVEGVTEFLPVSSTGHLLVAQNLIGNHQSDAFNLLIQVGPIAAAAIVFRKSIRRLATSYREPSVRDELVKLVTCFALTCAGGALAGWLGLSLPETVRPVTAATLIGGVAILGIEWHARRRQLTDEVTWPVVFAVAAAQLLAAVFPGTSRSGAAVMAALLLGQSRPAAVRFAFLVGIPTMLAAGALQVKMTIAAGQASQLTDPTAITAFAVATVTALAAVMWLLKYVQTHTFVPFAWYRVGLGLLLLALSGLGLVA